MQVLSRVLAIAPLLLLGACETVHVRSPIGSEPHSVDADDWNGTWILGSGDTCKLHVVDEEGGLLEVGFLEEEDDHLEPLVVAVQLREHGGWVLANVEDPEQPGFFLWMRALRDDEQLILWLPDPEWCASRVEEGDLPGTVNESGDVVLEALTEEVLDAIIGEPGIGLFRWDQPMAMIRIGVPD